MYIFFRSVHVLILSITLLHIAEILIETGIGEQLYAQNKSMHMELQFEPKTYMVYRAHQPITIDGNIDKQEWNQVPWSEPFEAISGDPRYFEDKPSRIKMLWDDDYLYVAAELTEPDIWATMTKRNSPLYNDNAFEIFIDPDGDTHNYFEFEINALGTIWDIYLNKPYRDGGIILSDWNLLTEDETAVKTYGTVNKPGERDEKWTVEVAIPIEHMLSLHTGSGKNNVLSGDYWKVNFARSHRKLVKKNRQYVLAKDERTGEVLPPVYDTWTSQSLINMHYPEMWGMAIFSEKKPGYVSENKLPKVPEAEYIKWYLRQLYYAMHSYQQQEGHFTHSVADLELELENVKISSFGNIKASVPLGNTVVEITQTQFEIVTKTNDGALWHINHEGRVWEQR